MIIAAKSHNNLKPFIFIDNHKSDQVVIRFLTRDEHVTIHHQLDGRLLKTHYFPDKSPSVWDDLRVQTARTLGLSKPERHANYIDHSYLSVIGNISGYYLLGRRIDLLQLHPKKNYYQKITNTIDVEKNNFMLQIYLSTFNNPRKVSGIMVSTSVGDICFEPTE